MLGTACESSLPYTATVYTIGDALVHRGRRPGPGWHGHGYTPASPLFLLEGRLVRRRVLKRRWRNTATGATITDQPPDLLPRRRLCTLLIASLLMHMLTALVGLHSPRSCLPELCSRRQMQRYLASALRHAERSQQAIRLALIERCEPRPVESLWESGLDPPEQVGRRSQHPGAPVTWRALEMLNQGALHLQIPISHLLAEARGRWTGNDQTFLI